MYIHVQHVTECWCVLPSHWKLMPCTCKTWRDMCSSRWKLACTCSFIALRTIPHMHTWYKWIIFNELHTCTWTIYKLRKGIIELKWHSYGNILISATAVIIHTCTLLGIHRFTDTNHKEIPFQATKARGIGLHAQYSKNIPTVFTCEVLRTCMHDIHGVLSH